MLAACSDKSWNSYFKALKLDNRLKQLKEMDDNE